MFHKEGFNIITITSILLVAGIIVADNFLETYLLQKTVQIALITIFLIVLQFFRNPKRNTVLNEHHIIAPVDGKVVEIKEVYEPEYFKDQRLQVSFFTSPINVHVVRYGLSGIIKYNKYHHKTQVAVGNPKTATDNGRTTIVIDSQKIGEVMYRQITGTFTKRIVNYAIEGNTVVQGEDAGFIKFGSRVDLFLPLNTKMNIKIGDQVKGGEQIVASK
ncbi:MAG: phosphatidylserine decarboxylase [Flavobacteriaceae bacterium]|nr:phosphatidylserine decarboxylase [Flavobacteriaceae bacterium]